MPQLCFGDPATIVTRSALLHCGAVAIHLNPILPRPNLTAAQTKGVIIMGPKLRVRGLVIVRPEAGGETLTGLRPRRVFKAGCLAHEFFFP